MENKQNPPKDMILPSKLISLVGVLIAILIIPISNHDNTAPSTVVGVPVIFKEESPGSYKSIEQMVDDGEYLYILFDRHEGLVRVYDTDGNYHQTIVLYTHGNGVFRIAVDTGTFYIQDKQHNMYIFCSGEFREFLTYKEGEFLRKSIDFEATSKNYVIRMESVWRITNSQEICIINRPQAALFSQGTLYSLIGIGFLILVVMLSLDWQNSLKKN